MSANLLSWLLNLLASNISMLRGGTFIMDLNLKGRELVENIASNVEVNMLSTLKNAKYI